MNYTELAIIAAPYVWVGVQSLARWTKTPKDDKIVSKVGKILNTVFLASRNK